jgi:L-seryl-tRNA(Ser) seleniumtransferase
MGGGFRELPPVNALLDGLLETFPGAPRALARRAARNALESARAAIAAGRTPPGDLMAAAVAGFSAMSGTGLGPVVNATGIILHTAFGRAALPPPAREALASAAEGYCSLQWDWEAGARGERDSHVEGLLRELTGAEAATVVNNNAGATLLVLAALAGGREVIVSRGQLVEIGGSFRIPDVMRQSGAVLREVGCTNRTHPGDYRSAIGPQTAAILRVHPSNYRIRGFSSEVSLEDLVAMGRESGIPVIDDLGAGSLVALSSFGLPDEPTIPASIGTGAAVTTSSGDKLIGGPQSGIICGRRDLVDRIRRHPLARALRVCKLTLAALEATLKVFLEDPGWIARNHPVYRMFSVAPDELRAAAAELSGMLALPEACRASVEPMGSYIGSGALPDTALPSWGLAVDCPDAGALASALRRARPAVAGRLENGRLYLDARTLLPGQAAVLAGILSGEARALWG